MHLIADDLRRLASQYRRRGKQSGSIIGVSAVLWLPPQASVPATCGGKGPTVPAKGQSMSDFSRDDVHSRTLTAFFDTRGAADQAVSDLEAAGIPRQHIHRVDGGATSTPTTMSTGDTGFFAALKDMFMPEEDRYGYAEGLQRGGFLVSVRADEANYTRVTDILDRDGAIDMDEREASWRKEGWTGYQAGGTATTVGYTAAGTAAAAGGVATIAANTGPTTVSAANTARGLETDRDEVIPVYEERLKVGKRDVSHGRVRLRSYVVETPVQEQVSLHSERVEVDRRPVDRAVTSADLAFQDRTIELEESAEEVVISKDVRVTEEVGLRKVAQERTETVSDKVRHTEVEVEDGRTIGAVAGAAGSLAAQVRAGLDIVGSDGVHVGTVDHMEGERIKLKKADPAAGGEHHYLTREMVQSVAGKVVLAVTAAEAKARWAKA